MDVQIKHRNCQSRVLTNSTGEVIVANDGIITAATGATVTTIPANVILKAIYVYAVGIGSDALSDVTAGNTTYTGVTIADNAVLEIDCSNRPVLAAEAVTVKPAADVTNGSIMVIAEYIDFETVTGRSVTPVGA